jgi:cytochrome b subunit of formate dehydrogenase
LGLSCARRRILEGTARRPAESGQDSVQFTLVLLLVALLITGVLILLGVDVQDLYGNMMAG